MCRTPATRRSNRNILADSARPRQIGLRLTLLCRPGTRPTVGGMTSGLVSLLVCTVMLGVACGIFLCQTEIARVLRRVRTRSGPEPAAGPPIEETARALRRVRGQVLAPAPGTPMARRRGTTAAYDDLLVHAARALGVPDTLTGLPEGTDREAERLRVEHLLRQAGLRLD